MNKRKYDAQGRKIRKFPGLSRVEKTFSEDSRAAIFRASRNIVAWKKCSDDHDTCNVIVKLVIPKGALIRCTPNTFDKIRVSAARVVSMTQRNIGPADVAYSTCDGVQMLEYRVGKTMSPVNPFDLEPYNDCSDGIHCYFEKESAERH